MATFTSSEILKASELFEGVSPELRNLVTGAMIGVNITKDKMSMSNMVNLALTMTGDKPA